MLSFNQRRPSNGRNSSRAESQQAEESDSAGAAQALTFRVAEADETVADVGDGSLKSFPLLSWSKEGQRESRLPNPMDMAESTLGEQPRQMLLLSVVRTSDLACSL